MIERVVGGGNACCGGGLISNGGREGFGCLPDSQ